MCQVDCQPTMAWWSWSFSDGTPLRMSVALSGEEELASGLTWEELQTLFS